MKIRRFHPRGDVALERAVGFDVGSPSFPLPPPRFGDLSSVESSTNLNVGQRHLRSRSPTPRRGNQPCRPLRDLVGGPLILKKMPGFTLDPLLFFRALFSFALLCIHLCISFGMFTARKNEIPLFVNTI